MKTRLLLTIILVTISFFIQAQNQHLLMLGDDYFKNMEYDKALNIYKRSLIKDENNALKLNKIAVVHVYLDNPCEAVEYFNKALKINQNIDIRTEFEFAKALQMVNRFEEAKILFEKCEKNNENNFDNIEIAELNRRTNECENGIKYINNSRNIKIENLGGSINSIYPEYAPVLTPDESMILFTSRRASTTGGGHDFDGLFFEDIYMSSKIDEKWSNPKNLDKPFNSEYHNSCIAISADAKTIFLYSSINTGDILYSKFNSKTEKWSSPKSISNNINKKDSFENSLTISSDENTVFFSSNMSGGYGGLDIWMSIKGENNSWGKPINLGPKINTKFDEDGPSLSYNGITLYFSSNRPSGMGGFDIYSSEYNISTSVWENPINLGFPINTGMNDIHFVILKDGRTAYFSSIREDSFGSIDIYKAVLENDN